MKLYGTLSELVAAVFRKGGKEVKIEPASQSGSGPIVITIPDVGSNAANLVTTGDTGTVTSTMIANGTIVDGDINAAAGIVDTKLATISTAGKVSNSATTATNSNTPSTIVARDGSGDFSAGTITATSFSGPLTGNVTGNVSGSAASFTGSLSGEVTGTQSATVVADDVIDNANIKSNAAIVDTKLATISTAGKVSGGAITSGTIGGTTSVNTTGTIAASTLTSSSTTTAMQVYINGTGNNGFLELEGQTVSGVAAPTNGEARLFAGTDGKIYVRKAGSTQAEELGAGGSGEINLVDNSSDAGSWVGTNAAVTTNTTAANNPLSGTIDSSIAIASSTSGGYAYYRFSMPAALKQRKLKLEWYQIAASLTSGAYRVEVYTNAASDYSGAYTELALSTDSGGNSPIPNLNGKYSTTFDTTSADYYEIRVVRTAASAATLYIANVVCGPGIQPQGAVVGEWVSYTPTYEGLGTVAGNSAKYRRVGDSMEVTFNVTAGTTSAVAATISLPTGFTVSSTAIQNNTIVGDLSATTTPFNNSLVYSSSQSGKLYFTSANAAYTSGAVGTTWANATGFGGNFMVPIAEWAGSGTVQLAQNDVEYASNNSPTATTNDTTNFVYGPSGSSIPTVVLSGNITKQVRFQTPIQTGDTLTLEILPSNGFGWVPVIGGVAADSSNRSIDAFSPTGTSGIGSIKAISATEAIVTFGRYRSSTAPWTDITESVKWRVRKASAGAVVGFGIVQPGVSSGLVSSLGLPGKTDGLVVPTGYVGERITWSVAPSGTFAVSTTEGDWTNASIALTPGVWLIQGSVTCECVTGTTAGNANSLIIKLTDSANATIQNIEKQLTAVTPANAAMTVTSTLSFSCVANVSANTTYKVRARKTAASNANIYNTTSGYSEFYAVRIA